MSSPERSARSFGFSLDRSAIVLFALLGAVSLTFLLVLGPSILSRGSLEAMAFQMPELGILSLAMMISLLSGGINLAVIATANFVAILMAFMLKALEVPLAGAEAIPGLALVILAGLIIASLVGLLNGLIIAYVGVSPILATLGTMTLLEGIAIGLTRGTVVSGFPDALLALGNAKLLGLPVPLWIFFVCAVPMAFVLSRMPLGISIYMIGSNEEATRYSGVNTKLALVKVYVISGLLCGVAAVVMMARFNSANASYAESYLLVTILAAVLGGVDPFGGFGRVLGLVLALVILQVTASGFNLLGFSSHLTLAIWGMLLIVTLMAGFSTQRIGR